MNPRPICVPVFFLLLCGAMPVFAEEDPLASYQEDINKAADADTVTVYDAWGNNMAHRIKRGYADGVVVDGSGEYANGKVHVDGLGNVTVEKGANVGPIINQTDIANSNVIIQNSKRF